MATPSSLGDQASASKLWTPDAASQPKSASAAPFLFPTIFQHCTVLSRNTVTAQVLSTPLEQGKRHPRQRLLRWRRSSTGTDPKAFQKGQFRSTPQELGDSPGLHALSSCRCKPKKPLYPVGSLVPLGRDALASHRPCNFAPHRSIVRRQRPVGTTSLLASTHWALLGLTHSQWPPPLTDNVAHTTTTTTTKHLLLTTTRTTTATTTAPHTDTTTFPRQHKHPHLPHRTQKQQLHLHQQL